METWSIDTEWGYQRGFVGCESAYTPVVLCAVALQSHQRVSFWGWDENVPAFIAAHSSDLFVAHNAVAEMKYLLRLGIELPEHWYDTYVAERHRTNSTTRTKVGLDVAVRRLRIDLSGKKETQRRILHLDFDANDPNVRQELIDYCFNDCDAALALYVHQTGGVA